MIDLAEARKLNQDLKDTTFVRGGIDFIPTPSAVAMEMVAHLDLHGDEFVLEPSAGAGALIDAILVLQLYDDVSIVAVEQNYNACQVLRNKYCDFVATVQMDFMDFDPVRKFPRIIMNPPWSKRQDVKHVLHAWDKCLADDGILVALVAKGIMYWRDKLTRRLRSLVHDEGEIVKSVTFKEPQVQGQLIRLFK